MELRQNNGLLVRESNPGFLISRHLLLLLTANLLNDQFILFLFLKELRFS